MDSTSATSSPEDGCYAAVSRSAADMETISAELRSAGHRYGEGSCRECGYPARAYHRNVGPIKFLQVILQYHRTIEAADRERRAAKGRCWRDSPQGGSIQ